MLIVSLWVRAKLSTGKMLNQHCLTQAFFVQKQNTLRVEKTQGFRKTQGFFAKTQGQIGFFDEKMRKNRKKSGKKTRKSRKKRLGASRPHWSRDFETETVTTLVCN